MSDDLWFSRSDEGKTMVDSMKKRGLLRLSVRWPLTIAAECRKPPSLRQEADRHTWRRRQPPPLVEPDKAGSPE
jgi:hypothetical protein